MDLTKRCDRTMMLADLRPARPDEDPHLWLLLDTLEHLSRTDTPTALMEFSLLAARDPADLHIWSLN